jgi:hypothetical protein
VRIGGTNGEDQNRGSTEHRRAGDTSLEFSAIDVGEVEWLREHNRQTGGPAGTFLQYAPAIFERYLRIFHAGQVSISNDGDMNYRDVPWSEMAAVTGKTLTPCRRGTARQVP